MTTEQNKQSLAKADVAGMKVSRVAFKNEGGNVRKCTIRVDFQGKKRSFVARHSSTQDALALCLSAAAIAFGVDLTPSVETP